MWIRAIDGKLVNLSIAQIIEVATNYVEESDIDGPPDFHTVDAVFARDGFQLLFQDTDKTTCEVALEVLAQVIAAHDTTDSISPGKMLSLAELMTKAGEDSKN